VVDANIHDPVSDNNENANVVNEYIVSFDQNVQAEELP
jgi:hypothetical protein